MIQEGSLIKLRPGVSPVMHHFLNRADGKRKHTTVTSVRQCPKDIVLYLGCGMWRSAIFVKKDTGLPVYLNVVNILWNEKKWSVTTVLEDFELVL